MVTTTHAQDAACPTLERTAVTNTQIACADVALAEACYGNPILDAELRDSTATFEAASERVPLETLTSLSSRADETSYGIALLHTTAYAVNSWREVPLTVIALGDVTLENTGMENITFGPTLSITVEALQGVNIRRAPQPDATIIAQIGQGDVLKLTGRSADSTWARAQLPDERIGWVAVSALNADVRDLDDVSLEQPASLPLYRPYASFDMFMETAAPRCDDAWQSGVLVQATSDETVQLRLNERDVLLTGTLFAQATGDLLTLYALEGELATDDWLVVAGEALVIPLNGEAQPRIGAYDYARLAPIPTEILPRFIYVGLDVSQLLTPAPQVDRSPIIDVLVTDPCVITTGQTGANLRAGPDTAFAIRGVMAFRETANPIGRATGSDGLNWWQLAQNVWISGATTVTGGDCLAVPQAQRIPVLPPTPTPDS